MDDRPQATEYIRWVQNALNRIMNTRLPVDGIMGFETRNALRRFQQQAGLLPTGFVGPPTEKALVAALTKQTPQQKYEHEFADEAFIDLKGEEEINRRSRAYIRWLQGALNRIMGFNLAIDGIAGPQTRNSIRRFQRRQGLKSDGIVGPKTERALVAAGAGAPPIQAVRPPATIAPEDPDRPDWIDWAPSPYRSSRAGNPVTAIIYHYTAGPSLTGTVRWFQNNPRRVSAHYVIGKDGRVVQMVPLAYSAHHAGSSNLPGCRRGVNRCSIGIEIVNWGVLTKRNGQFFTYSGRRYIGLPPVFVGGRWWEPYTPAQVNALIRLTRHLLSRYPGITHITGHEDIAPGRKSDPGGAFDWQAIRAGLAPLYAGHLGPLTDAPVREIKDYSFPVVTPGQETFADFEVDGTSIWEFSTDNVVDQFALV